MQYTVQPKTTNKAKLKCVSLAFLDNIFCYSIQSLIMFKMKKKNLGLGGMTKQTYRHLQRLLLICEPNCFTCFSWERIRRMNAIKTAIDIQQSHQDYENVYDGVESSCWKQTQLWFQSYRLLLPQILKNNTQQYCIVYCIRCRDDLQ